MAGPKQLDRRYHINSTGNGALVCIERLSDGASLFLQGDDAARFVAETEHTGGACSEDDVCEQYAPAFQKGGNRRQS